MPPKKQKTISEKYQMLSHIDHIKKLPDSYIGSTVPVESERHVYDEETKRMILKTVQFVPGLYKIFDEIIVNAEDEASRAFDTDNPVSKISISIDKTLGEINITNTGGAIDVEKHEEHKIYVPEMIFGNLLTSANYDMEEDKTTGGKNGYGAKLTNIYSKSFKIEVMDSIRGRLYKQEWKDNMSIKSEPIIKKQKRKESWVSVSFIPDWSMFNLTSLTNDMEQILKKRAYDVCACTPKCVLVQLNGKKLDIKAFDKYVDLYLGSNKTDNPRIHDNNQRWEVVVAPSNDGRFHQTSFVNGIHTIRGGTHVNHVVNQICKKLSDLVKKKLKKTIKVQYIKDHLTVFIRSIIVNPSFDSQVKETLTTEPKSFGSKWEVPDKFIQALFKTGITEMVVDFADFKENSQMKKKTDGKKRATIRGIPKLEDANHAGTNKSNDCTLILTEGDSAKAMVLSGMGSGDVTRDRFGVFPLRGKLLNTRDASIKQISENAEINQLKQILGLQSGEDYSGKNLTKLRYGRIMVMTDADLDGSHIKGLVMNMLHSQWPSLIKVPNFMNSFKFPIVKAIKKSKVLEFYTEQDYQAWKKIQNSTSGWEFKYYKGLGTNTKPEAQKYFKNLDFHQINYEWEGNTSNMSLVKAFDKKLSDDRKDWLSGYDPDKILDTKKNKFKFEDFIDHDLVHFSAADNIRSIPSIYDGLKPSLRKILYSVLKRNIQKDIKVAQLSGYVSEQTEYHHGEASLQKAIIGMAQDYIGSNNINLLFPSGQFGTRYQGGKDAASPRYIFTRLPPLTTVLFNKHDTPVLPEQFEDGTKIEPKYFVPIIPMILVNGTEGIGTGWSTSLPSYNPDDIIANIRRKMEDEELHQMTPWYKNFKGTITKVDDCTYKCKGCYNVKMIGDNTILEVTELPIGIWTEKFKEILECLIGDSSDGKKKINAGIVKDYTNNSTDSDVLFQIKLVDDRITKLLSNSELFEKAFHLAVSIKTSNMHLYDTNGRIKKYSNPNEILEEFFDARIIYYLKRKDYLIEKLKRELDILKNKVRFINEVIAEDIIVFKRKKDQIISDLTTREYMKISNDAVSESSFNYLIKMPIYNFSQEEIDSLITDLTNITEEYDLLYSKTPINLWDEDLYKFKEEYKKVKPIVNKKISLKTKK
jgi:DNA topoisomerase II